MVTQIITVNVGQSEQREFMENGIFQLHLATESPGFETRTNSDTSNLMWHSPFIDSSYESIFSQGLHSYEHIWRALADR